jgi:hypothetical protein
MKTIEQIEQELAKLTADLETLKAAKEGEWPRIDEHYYSIVGNVVQKTLYFNDDDDKAKLSLGNAYRTTEESKLIIKNRCIHTRLKQLAGGFEPDWDSASQCQYVLAFSSLSEKSVFQRSAFMRLPNTVYFEKEIPNIQSIIDGEFGEGSLQAYCERGVI